MLNREDMLELTRRMTVSRTSFTRIAGGYMDTNGEIDGTFNTNFLKLKTKDREANLAIAKAIPFAETNVNLKEYTVCEEAKQKGSIWQMLQAIRTCGLKNDALMEIFYEIVAEKYQNKGAYEIVVFHDRYDIPVKAADKERLGESEEVYEYLICAICPLEGEYEPGMPECGFLFPSFKDRSCDMDHIAVFNRNSEYPHMEIEELFHAL